MAFSPATKKQTFLRLALLGPAGSGKSFSALRIATALAQGGKIAAFDTERKSLSKYAGDVNPDGGVFAFDVEDDMRDFDTRRYIDAIRAAADGGYAVLVIDSLSHAWAGPGGILEFVDSKKGSGNNFAAWRDATPMHNRLVDTILNAPLHVVATMRTKMEYVLEDDGKGKKVPRKVGMQPVQRDGVEYEFDVIADMDDSTMTISKTRCAPLKGRRFVEPGKDLAAVLTAWLSAGEARSTAPADSDKPEHHASWAKDQAGFCAALRQLGLEHDAVADYCVAKNRPRPSVMTGDQRRKLHDYLASEPGRTSFDAWRKAAS